MDGSKTKLMRSLQYRLSVWLLLAIIAMALAGGILSFATAIEEANELQDDQLRQVASLMHGQALPLAAQPSAEKSSDPDFDMEFRIVVQIISAGGVEVLLANQPPLALAFDVPEGIQTLELDDGKWRIYVKTLNPKQRAVVAQKIHVRDEVAKESAIATLIPFIILIPVLLVLLSYLIREMFKPVKKIALALDQRSEQDLYAVDERDLPSEILPFVVATNRMLLRVDQLINEQRRFVADAAHEMRTPLTALSLQVERLEAAEMSDQATQRLSTLKHGLARTRLLLNQLLAFARSQMVNGEDATDVSVQQVFRQVLEDLMPLAETKNIDIGIASEQDAVLSVNAFDFTVMIKNLVDNSIRYTPAGGKIDLLLEQGAHTVTIKVRDNGPGIAAAERERVFDPFYRVLGDEQAGSGLGLSIVKAIALKVGAQIHLGVPVVAGERSGLCVSVVFPMPKTVTD